MSVPGKGSPKAGFATATRTQVSTSAGASRSASRMARTACMPSAMTTGVPTSLSLPGVPVITLTRYRPATTGSWSDERKAVGV